MILNMTGGAGGTGGALTVNAPAGVTVTATKDSKTYTRTANPQGVAVFKGLSTGTWAVTISDGVQTPATQHIEITADYDMTIAFFAAYIHSTWPAGSTCMCQKGNVTLVAPSGAAGSYTFTVSEVGEWKVSCTDSATGDYTEEVVTIEGDGQSVNVNLAYRLTPNSFNLASYGTLGTDYEVVYDDDTTIPEDQWANAENWKIRFLNSGTVTATQEGKIDVFCVGGGSGCSSRAGGSGGYTKTKKNVVVQRSENYEIVVGAGGAGVATSGIFAGKAGTTSAFDVAAEGGDKFNGGSGGGGANSDCNAGDGGTDGADGTDGVDSAGTVFPGGHGQGTTTREFGEEDGKLYAGGGAGSANESQLHGKPGDGGGGEVFTPGTPNTGGGAGGTTGAGGTLYNGGSGIVVIRNARGTRITVKYPPGSICTCSKGDVVLSASDTSGSYTFAVPETGDWIVSCTDGTKTKSQTVTISEEGQLENVTLAYILYLYNSGDECTDVTGGWIARNLASTTDSANKVTPTVKRNTNDINVSIPSAGWYQQGGLWTSKKVDVSNYDTLHFDCIGNGSGQTCFLNTDVGSTNNENAVAELFYYNTSRTTNTIDISEITGSVYVQFSLNTGKNESPWLTLYSVYLT